MLYYLAAILCQHIPPASDATIYTLDYSASGNSKIKSAIKAVYWELFFVKLGPVWRGLTGSRARGMVATNKWKHGPNLVSKGQCEGV